MSFLNGLILMFEVYHHKSQKRMTLCEKHLKECQKNIGNKYLTVNGSNDKQATCDACVQGAR